MKIGAIAQRENRWVLIDITGKGNRVRSVAVPAWVITKIPGVKICRGEPMSEGSRGRCERCACSVVLKNPPSCQISRRMTRGNALIQPCNLETCIGNSHKPPTQLQFSP